MKDTKYIIIFVVIGLALSYVVSAPLRKPPESMPRVGTPLQSMQEMTQPGAARSQGQEHVYAEGTISLGKGVTPTQTLFVTIRALADGKVMGGPPLAAKKIVAPTFPIQFSLSDADSMTGAEFYAGDVALTVRLDADGMAGPKQPDDIENVLTIKAAQPRHLDVTLNK